MDAIVNTLSILIPTHNRREILQATLDSLNALEVPDDVAIDVVIIANACTDGTEEMVKMTDMRFPTQCIIEPVPNLNLARNRAASAAKGQILALVDDDIWFESDWAIGILEIYHNEHVDLVQGKVTLWFNTVTRPSWMTDSIAGLLSYTDFGSEITELTSFGSVVGANLSFRRHVWERLGGFASGLDRTGSRLIGGGDVEFVQRASRNGMRVFYSPRAAVRHRVAPHRVKLDYLCAVASGNAESRVFIRPSLSLARICRSIVGNVYLLALHACLCWLSELRRDEAAKMWHHILIASAFGGLRGIFGRLRGAKLGGL
jgi:glycosyltransferase involved in cell wall biosynthesis